MKRIEINSKVILMVGGHPAGGKIDEKDIGEAILRLEQFLNSINPPPVNSLKLYPRFHFEVSKLKL